MSLELINDKGSTTRDACTGCDDMIPLALFVRERERAARGWGGQVGIVEQSDRSRPSSVKLKQARS